MVQYTYEYQEQQRRDGAGTPSNGSFWAVAGCC